MSRRRTVFFFGSDENILIFASEQKQVVPRMTVGTVGIDTHFNKWPSKLIPFGGLIRCDPKTYAAVFHDDTVTADVDIENADDGTSGADDLGLKDSKRILFPQEHAMDLGQQLMEVRGHR